MRWGVLKLDKILLKLKCFAPRKETFIFLELHRAVLASFSQKNFVGRKRRTPLQGAQNAPIGAYSNGE